MSSKLAILERQPELQDRRDLGKNPLHLGLDVAGLINDVDLALFLSGINTGASAAGPTIQQVRVGIVIAIYWRRRRANGVEGLYGIITGVQEISSVGCAQKHALGVFIESRIRNPSVRADANGKHQNIVLSGGGTGGVAHATISYQISLIHDAV